MHEQIKEAIDKLKKALRVMPHIEHKPESNDTYCLVNEVLALLRSLAGEPPEELTAEQENDKHEKPCPYNKSVPCVQYPEDSCGCNPCEECEAKLKAEEPRCEKYDVCNNSDHCNGKGKIDRPVWDTSAPNDGRDIPCPDYRAEEPEAEEFTAVELEQHRWIPVSERLPEVPLGPPNASSDNVWLILEGKAYAGYYTNFVGWRVYGQYQRDIEHQKDITHWKPIILPE